MGQNKIIGIDLGTTNSCVAVIEGGKPVVIPNAEGNRTTPSIVSFDPNGTRLVGLPAKRQAIKNPDRTIQSIKRHMGSNFRVEIDHMSFSPEQVSACILQKLKLQAQAYLGEKVTKAIITVPAYFDDSQRLATRHAGEIAGLDVVRVINEPTASALAYGLNKIDTEANMVIFDFGGGTFDVTILQLAEGVLQVKATNGNNQLGGDDFDERIINWMMELFTKNTGTDLKRDLVAMQRLKETAEKVKIELSGLASAMIELPFLSYGDGEPLHLNTEIFQNEFNDLTADLVKATADPIERALRDAHLRAEQIDHVLLVGGTTRIPAVQNFIRTYFNREPVKSVNPDEAVAMGAAIQGGILTGEIQEVLLLDVIPLTLGVEEDDGKFSKVIERNTTIPVTRKRSFVTTQDNQTNMTVHVLQGEHTLASENISLARFEITNIPAGPTGSQQVDVEFDIDADGIFHCTAIHQGGVKKELVLKRTSGFNQDELDKLKKEEEQQTEREQRINEKIAASVLAETALSDAERIIHKFGEGSEDERVEKVRHAAKLLKQAVGVAEPHDLERLRQNLETAMQACSRVGTQPRN
jgi:molecular chaperone DnaK